MTTKKIITGVIFIIAIVGAALGIYHFANNKDENQNEKTYIVTFNTDGGTAIDSIQVKENEKISLPENPTKEGYEFVEWQINEAAFNSDMEVNKDLELTAIWKEVTVIVHDDKKSSTTTTKKTTTKKTTTTTTTTKKTYTCPNGYNLDGTKCVKTYDAPHRCPDGLYEINGQCVDVTTSKRVDQLMSCKTGTKINIGYDVCKTTDRISVDSQSSCTTANGIWLSSEGACYEKGEASYTCPNNYVYLANPGSYNSGIHGNAGCYPVSQMRYTCTNTKTDVLEGTKCISTIDAK